MKNNKPIKIINSIAPIRICDIGGWTDTWFAEYGEIFNIGVYPYTEVQIEIYPYSSDLVIIQAENYGEKYTIDHNTTEWDRHPLIEAAIYKMNLPQKFTFQINVYSEAPVGASVGTSAAVSVALVGALDRLTHGKMSLEEIAYTAHFIETEILKHQSGIQDQICSAFGGLNHINMYKYPRANISRIEIPDSIWWELERRLVLIYLGKSHSSSKVHEKVIQELENSGPQNKKLEDLRITAKKAITAIKTGNLDRFGAIMIENTEAQGRLHPDIISKDANKIIEIAKEYGALGYKINGAGGDGGSITILCGSLSHKKRAMISAIEDENPMFKNIPIYLSRRGLRVWEIF
ncbi:MAG: GHMP family kinase ATP-binding protein [Candidatus Helarchaeota archaeon]